MNEPTRCSNCDTPLHGEWCHACGQRQIELERNVGVLVKEGLSETFEADGRIAATFVPLFFRPGVLVKEVMAGRRATYSSPIRIYLLATLLCFFSLSFATSNTDSELVVHQGGVQLTSADDPRAIENRERRATGERSADVLIEELGPVGDLFGPGVRSLEEMDPADASTHFFEEVFDVLPKVLLVLVPALAAMLKLLWFRRPFIEHLLFSLNLHSVGMIVISVAAVFGSDTVLFLAPFAVVTVHALVGARRVYESSWLGTIVRVGFAGAAYLVLLLFGVLVAALAAIALA